MKPLRKILQIGGALASLFAYSCANGNVEEPQEYTQETPGHIKGTVVAEFGDFDIPHPYYGIVVESNGTEYRFSVIHAATKEGRGLEGQTIYNLSSRINRTNLGSLNREKTKVDIDLDCSNHNSLGKNNLGIIATGCVDILED